MKWLEKPLGGNELNDRNEPSEYVGIGPFTQKNSECKGPEAGDIW